MNEATLNSILSDTGLKIGVIGIGNAGGQAAVAAAQSGHNVFVINTSDKDLDDSVLHQSIKCHLIGDGRGSGKNRENAMALLKSRGKEGILEIFNNPYFKEIVEPADLVVVIFSTGGGTGSGTGPYLASMIHQAFSNKVVLPYGILPKSTESVMAQANTIACVDDISKIHVPYMLADLDFYGADPQEKSFEKISKYITETLNVLRGDYLKMSANGMADERDVLTVVAEPGYLAIHFCNGVQDGQLATKTLQGYLIDQIKSSPACRIQRDGLLQYNLLITNCNGSIEDNMKVGDYTELNNYVGEPKATYSNYSVDDTLSSVQVISVMSGLTIPMDRFASVKAKVEENKAKYEKQSRLNLKEDREKTNIRGNDSVKDIIMGSHTNQTANLDFLDGEF